MNYELKKARERSGITQRLLARKIGISIRQYLRIEKGEQDPSTTKSLLIATVLNSTVEELFSKCLLRQTSMEKIMSTNENSITK